MYSTTIVMILFATSLEEVDGRRRITNRDEAALCHINCHEFNCACEDEDWMSAEAECIPFRWLCDAEQDCSNRADEIDCICPPGQEQCGSDRGGNVKDIWGIYDCVVRNGFCWQKFDHQDYFVPFLDCDDSAAQCDGYTDCPNGDDERNCDHCPFEIHHRCACNQPDQFICDTLSWVCFGYEDACDGEKDCGDGSDEYGCNCRDDLFTCDCYKNDNKSCSGSGCVPLDKQCNDEKDCSDGSDEYSCISCRDGLFTCDCYKNDTKSCSGRRCIPLRWQCDGLEDCSDGSDEESCLSCRNDQFTCDCYKNDTKSCSGRRCVSLFWQCDGSEDCRDGSDEEGCLTCRDGLFSCDCYKNDTNSCSGKRCIPLDWQCNGFEDCNDGSDEEGCLSCRDGLFTCDCYKNDTNSCSGRRCIPLDWQCNGLEGCSDGSDEEGCLSCRDGLFTCDCYKNDKNSCSGSGCFSMFQQCDGWSDCNDGSDEEGCLSCRDDLFPCDCYENDTKSCIGRGCFSMFQQCDGWSVCSDDSDEEGCTACRDGLFTCDCYKNDTMPCIGEGCVQLDWQCNGLEDCSDGSDEEGCFSCRDGLFTCDCYKNDTKSCIGRGCMSLDRQCNGLEDCSDGSDEEGCFSCRDDLFTCDCYKNDTKSCIGRGCISLAWQCNGLEDCSDGSDEESCLTCGGDQFTCDCYKNDKNSCSGSGCFSMFQQCDGWSDCSDDSDEESCTACRDGLFTCDCYRTRHKSCQWIGCIPIHRFLNGFEDCEDGSDERIKHFRKRTWENYDVLIWRFDVVQQCNVYADCDASTCVILPSFYCTTKAKCNTSQAICTSRCNTVNASQLCNVFQCQSGQLEIAPNFCDRKVDCQDGSDEIKDQPGFKCSASFGRCVLPQINLHDGVAQCDDGSDLCSHIPCFECLDGRLIISQTQLCDGIIDCFDLSDECLCDVYLRKSVCEEKFVLNDLSQPKCEKLNPKCYKITSSFIETAQCKTQFNFDRSNVTTTSRSLPSHISCENKFEAINAATCDGRPDCKDLSDECSCEDPPSFCSDPCHDFYPIGDRYCDGLIDKAWKFINDSSCPEGFDEKFCPQRFTCKAENLVNIDRVKVCDGRVDCDDESDEVNCKKESRDTLFSSQTEMISSVGLRVIFLFMSLLVILGNSVVIFSTTRLLYKVNGSESQNLNHTLMINLSVSDFLMGVYLLIISVKSVQYSGVYGDVDYQWRSSLECSIIGSFAVISSETSCFVMTILTGFRLYNILNPFTARTASTLKWKFAILLAWLVSLVLALLPVFKATSNYFVHDIWFSNKFTSRESWNKTDVMTFACRLASLSNQSIEFDGDAWKSTKQYIGNNFPQYLPLGEVGYYGETSICMPRIYASRGDQAWEYSLVIITFNFISFVFVAISYLLIYCKASNPSITTNRSDVQDARMQRRIARLIATDFVCWIPICIMVYLKTGGVEISNLVYIVTAGILLPINSALNPLLYSAFLEKCFGKLVASISKLRVSELEN